MLIMLSDVSSSGQAFHLFWSLRAPGLDRGDGRRPDGITVFPFCNGRSLVWDCNCVDMYAASHLMHMMGAVFKPGTAAGKAEIHKRLKYERLGDSFIFESVAIETTGVYGPSTTVILDTRTSERSFWLLFIVWHPIKYLFVARIVWNFMSFIILVIWTHNQKLQNTDIHRSRVMACTTSDDGAVILTSVTFFIYNLFHIEISNIS